MMNPTPHQVPFKDELIKNVKEKEERKKDVEFRKRVCETFNSTLTNTNLRAGHTMTRKGDRILYLETAGLNLRETSHPGSVPSSD